MVNRRNGNLRADANQTMIPNAKKFQPGVSGNPGGRPKGIAAKAREHTDQALKVLVEGLTDKDPRVRVIAAKEVLDRGYGKPVTMTADVTKRLDEWSDDDIDSALDALRASVSDDPATGARTGGETAH